MEAVSDSLLHDSTVRNEDSVTIADSAILRDDAILDPEVGAGAD